MQLNVIIKDFSGKNYFCNIVAVKVIFVHVDFVDNADCAELTSILKLTN